MAILYLYNGHLEIPSPADAGFLLALDVPQIGSAETFSSLALVTWNQGFIYYVG